MISTIWIEIVLMSTTQSSCELHNGSIMESQKTSYSYNVQNTNKALLQDQEAIKRWSRSDQEGIRKG